MNRQTALSALTQHIRKFDDMRTEERGYAKGEKLAGNVVKEAHHNGTAAGLLIAINHLLEAKAALAAQDGPDKCVYLATKCPLPGDVCQNCGNNPCICRPEEITHECDQCGGKAGASWIERTTFCHGGSSGYGSCDGVMRPLQQRDTSIADAVPTLLRDTATFADEKERASCAPKRDGQFGVQLDNLSIWMAQSSVWREYPDEPPQPAPDRAFEEWARTIPHLRARDGSDRLDVSARDARLGWTAATQAAGRDSLEIIGMLQQHLQPDGSPPGGGAVILAKWIIESARCRLSDLEQRVTQHEQALAAGKEAEA